MCSRALFVSALHPARHETMLPPPRSDPPRISPHPTSHALHGLADAAPPWDGSLRARAPFSSLTRRSRPPRATSRASTSACCAATTSPSTSPSTSSSSSPSGPVCGSRECEPGAPSPWPAPSRSASSCRKCTSPVATRACATSCAIPSARCSAPSWRRQCAVGSCPIRLARDDFSSAPRHSGGLASSRAAGCSFRCCHPRPTGDSGPPTTRRSARSRTSTARCSTSLSTGNLSRMVPSRTRRAAARSCGVTVWPSTQPSSSDPPRRSWHPSAGCMTPTDSTSPSWDNWSTTSRCNRDRTPRTWAFAAWQSASGTSSRPSPGCRSRCAWRVASHTTPSGCAASDAACTVRRASP